MGEVRIIGGIHGSRRIQVPASVSRPTTDRVRESLLSSLESAYGGLAGARVLDAFAGSGALGLEALSRGAALACLVERDARAAKVLAANARMLGYGPEQACIVRADALASAATIASQGPFDVVFLDPPYAHAPEAVAGFLDALAGDGGIAEGGFIAYEHARDAVRALERAFAETPFTLVRQKRYGGTLITLLQAR